MHPPNRIIEGTMHIIFKIIGVFTESPFKIMECRLINGEGVLRPPTAFRIFYLWGKSFKIFLYWKIPTKTIY